MSNNDHNTFLHYLRRNTLTDITRGERFAEMFRGLLLYVVKQRHPFGKRSAGWFIRTIGQGGILTRWTRAPSGEVERAAKAVLAAMRAEADEYLALGPADDPETRELIEEFVRQSRRPGLRGMIEAAKSEPGMWVKLEVAAVTHEDIEAVRRQAAALIEQRRTTANFTVQSLRESPLTHAIDALVDVDDDEQALNQFIDNR